MGIRVLRGKEIERQREFYVREREWHQEFFLGLGFLVGGDLGFRKGKDSGEREAKKPKRPLFFCYFHFLFMIITSFYGYFIYFFLFLKF